LPRALLVVLIDWYNKAVAKMARELAKQGRSSLDSGGLHSAYVSTQEIITALAGEIRTVNRSCPKEAEAPASSLPGAIMN
jgi:hypothetical protein